MGTVISYLYRDESGQGVVEYALIIAIIALALASALNATGTELKAFFNDFKGRMQEISR